MTGKSDWQGRVGTEWARRAASLDRLLGPVGEAGIDMLALGSGNHVLDVGCGSGASSLKLSQTGAKVTGIDISDDLLAVAHDRNVQRNIEFKLADAATHKFENPFDGLFSRFGVMFFEDPVSALGNLRNSLKKDAPAVIVTWCERERNIWASLPSRSVADLITLAPPSEGPGPFAWSDPAYFSALLKKAGWQQVSWQRVEKEAVMEAGDAEDPLERAAEFALRIGPLASNLRGADNALRTKVRQRLVGAFSPYLSSGNVRVPTTAWVIRAQA